MPSPLPAYIALSTSPAGVVATAHGEHYDWATTALQLTGWQRRPADGAFILPHFTGDALRALVHVADRHRTAVVPTGRTYLGDIAGQIAAHLPGTWAWRVEIWSRPEWQHDLVADIWDDGDLVRAMHAMDLRAGALLTDGAVELFLTERPGHPSDYLIGALAPTGFDDNSNKPICPRSITLPGAPRTAAAVIARHFLPAYYAALFARRLDMVTAGLARLRQAHTVLTGARASGRLRDGTPLTSVSTAALEEDFTGEAFQALRVYLIHAPHLLDRSPARPNDAAALDRLRTAMTHSATAFGAWGASVIPGTPTTARTPDARADAEARLAAALRPVIDTWLADGDALLRHARRALPRPPDAGTTPALTSLPPGSSSRQR
jgi:hypothetical protein